MTGTISSPIDLTCDEFECQVCMENFAVAELKIMKCTHKICFACSAGWAIAASSAKRNRCPTCNEEVRTFFPFRIPADHKKNVERVGDLQAALDEVHTRKTRTIYLPNPAVGPDHPPHFETRPHCQTPEFPLVRYAWHVDPYVNV